MERALSMLSSGMPDIDAVGWVAAALVGVDP